MNERKKKPFWMPSGGKGALIFWSGLCLLFGGTALYFHGLAVDNDRAARLVRDEQELLRAENRKLHFTVDKLQTEIAETGSLLRNREQILRDTTESLQAVKKEKEEVKSVVDPRKGIADLKVKIETALKTLPAAADVTVLQNNLSIVLRLNNSLLFNNGELSVNAKGTELLMQISHVLRDATTSAELEAQSFTDNQPPTGPVAMVCPGNLELTARRATSVVRVLSKEGQWPMEKIKAVGLGEVRPLAGNDTKEDRASNRRIELVLTVSPPEEPEPKGS